MSTLLPDLSKLVALAPHLRLSYLRRSLADAQEALDERDLVAVREALDDATDCAAYLNPSDLQSQITNLQSARK